MRIALATDSWLPQVNGVIHTLDATVKELRAMGHEVLVVTHHDFVSLPIPHGDSLVLPSYRKLARIMSEFRPDTVWIATQGPLALCAQIWSRRNNVHFIFSFHTRFPEYFKIRFGIPAGLLYGYIRLLFPKNAPLLVPSQSLARHLRQRDVGNPVVWSRGVDLDRYLPRPKTWTQYKRPIQLYVGRVVTEKNVEAFLRTEVEGTRIVVGDGPQFEALRASYPDAVFLGELHGEELARAYSEADVLVFPSLLDTFGLVVLEALASGIPVAALPSPHLVEIFGKHGVVSFDEDLDAAIRRALLIPAERCREVAEQFSWRESTIRLLGIIEQDRRKGGFDQ